MAKAPQTAFKLSDLLGSHPAPIQVQLLGASEHEVGMITGYAAGKTRGICAKVIEHCIKYPQAKALVGRKTFLEMVNTVKQPFFVMADQLHRAGWITKPTNWDYREGTNNLRFRNGSQIFFSNLDDPIKFRNEEYSLVVVDQAEEILEELWETLLARIRWALVPAVGWQAIAAANDEGHNWVWRRFVETTKKHNENPQRCQKDEQCVFLDGHPNEEGEPRDIPCATRRFFHGTTLDNKHNLSSRYLASLLSNPSKKWIDRFIFATMEGGSGRLLPNPRIVEHFDPPRHWPRYRAIDHGLNSPCCCLWITANIDSAPIGGVSPGALYVYKEYWEAESSVDQHAKRILDLSKGESVLNTVIDRSTFYRTQSRQEGGRVSLADLYAEEGLYCTASVGEPFPRVERIVMAHNRGMAVSDRCVNTIRQMPEYYAEQSRISGEFRIVNKSDFHAIDALGYGLMVIPMDPREEGSLIDDKPEYLRRPVEDVAERVHHTQEWKRFKQIEESTRAANAPRALESIPTREFLGDTEFGEEQELSPAYDPFWSR